MTEEELKLENRKLDIQLKIHQEKQGFERRRIEIEEHKRDYHNPVFIALIAAVVGLLSNAFVAIINNDAKVEQASKSTQSNLILKAIETGGNPDQAAENLQLLIDTKLIKGPTASDLTTYLASRDEGEGASLGASAASSHSSEYPRYIPSTSKEHCTYYETFGIPGNSENTICRIGFVFEFDKESKFTKWLGYNISKEKMRQRRKRSPFYLDPEINKDSQIGKNLYVRNNLDRGHLARLSDMSWDSQAHIESQLYSVVAPQYSNLNQILWLGLEDLTSDAVYNGTIDELLIYSGPIFGNLSEPKFRDIAHIPKDFFRIVYEPATGKSAAWIVPNSPDLQRSLKSQAPWTEYQVSIDDIEEKTGLDFFNSMGEKKTDMESSRPSLNWLMSDNTKS